MSKPQTLVTRNDRQRLGTMLERAYAVAFDPRNQVQRFELELDHAHAVEEEDIPPDVVTMHSTVEIIGMCCVNSARKSSESSTWKFRFGPGRSPSPSGRNTSTPRKQVDPRNTSTPRKQVDPAIQARCASKWIPQYKHAAQASGSRVPGPSGSTRLRFELVFAVAGGQVRMFSTTSGVIFFSATYRSKTASRQAASRRSPSTVNAPRGPGVRA